MSDHKINTMDTQDNKLNQDPAYPASSQPWPPGLRWITALVLIGLVALLVWLTWHWLAARNQAKHPPPPVPVRTALVTRRTVPITRTGVGNVTPVMSVTVHTRVDGQLDNAEFKEGQDVKTGQVLARIDPRIYKAQLDQSLAQKAKDEATLANARVDLTRYEALIKEDATTRQTLDTQRALVGQLQAAVKNDDAQIELARVNLSYTTITAPITGRVGARLVDPGNIVHAADAGGLVVINQIDPIAVQFTLPERAFQTVNAAQHASATPLTVQALDRDSGETLASGHLVLLNNQIDASTGTITLKGQFPNLQHKLWPGQQVDARLVLGQREQALTAPSAAVQRGQDGLYAYVIDADGKARMQSIQIDEINSQGDTTVITQGLLADERIVVDGQYRLTPGAQVVEMGSGNSQNGGKSGDNGPRAGDPRAAGPRTAQ
ncbi:MAG: efflux RND transporter periplasmic adaptor subunit [Burkholderiaceae bacterium]|jgi:multidrug efflux system membrane fusion protein|nr:efflux RND transporter periplasmic adaptor subunit [Burkholderiaceae bacterium]